MERIASGCSENVTFGHWRCQQRHTRFDQHSTGRPPAGRSRTRRSRRSWSTATAEHEGHPMRSSVVATCTCSSPLSSTVPTTPEPRQPEHPHGITCSGAAAAPVADSALALNATWGLRVRALGRKRIVRPKTGRLRQPEDHVATRRAHQLLASNQVSCCGLYTPSARSNIRSPPGLPCGAGECSPHTITHTTARLLPGWVARISRWAGWGPR